MSRNNRVDPPNPRRTSPRARLGLAAAGGLSLLAVVETVQAIVSPLRAPTEAHWAAASAAVRRQFRPGDLVVAAPAWADPILRQHLGDLLPIAAAARLDDARFGHVWELSQRGASAPERVGRVGRLVGVFGALEVRDWERTPTQVTYDFLDRWKDAYVTRWSPASRTSIVCPWQSDRFVCPGSGNTVQRTLVEIDNRIREALLAPPVLGEILAVEFPAVTLGRELVFAVGLHDTWARKSPGTVYFEVWIAGKVVSGGVVSNRTTWNPTRIDTSPRDGQVVSVRFQITSPRPEARYLSFAAEARR